MFMFILNSRKEASSHQNSVQETPGKGHAAKYRVNEYDRFKSLRDFCHVT